MELDPLSPLLQFYLAEGVALPEVELVDAGRLPQPAQRLLVHDVDMTSTLQRFFGREIYLDILNKEHVGSLLKRKVVLRLKGVTKPVEFGAIEIHLKHMPEQAKQAVIEGVRPLGGILTEFGVEYESQPSAFFQVAPDELMSRCFDISSPATLYGRCNTLTYAHGDVLANVVEVLPPLSMLTSAID